MQGNELYCGIEMYHHSPLLHTHFKWFNFVWNMMAQNDEHTLLLAESTCRAKRTHEHTHTNGAKKRALKRCGKRMWFSLRQTVENRREIVAEPEKRRENALRVRIGKRILYWCEKIGSEASFWKSSSEYRRFNDTDLYSIHYARMCKCNVHIKSMRTDCLSRTTRTEEWNHFSVCLLK